MLEELLSYKKPDHRGSDHNHGMITVNMGVVFSENVPDTNILGKKKFKVKSPKSTVWLSAHFLIEIKVRT